MHSLLEEIRACTLCAASLPRAPKPVLNFAAHARVLIAGQAPGTKAHDSGTPWNDASGERLRDWLGVTREQFYEPSLFAIVPMGFCYPGRGKSGDLPPRPECSQTWHARIAATLTRLELKVIIGSYAADYHLQSVGPTLTDTVRDWKAHGPNVFALPHPSPRNNLWLKKNPWFEREVLPRLKQRVREALGGR